MKTGINHHLKQMKLIKKTKSPINYKIINLFDETIKNTECDIIKENSFDIERYFDFDKKPIKFVESDFVDFID